MSFIVTFGVPFDVPFDVPFGVAVGVPHQKENQAFTEFTNSSAPNGSFANIN